MSPIEPVVRVLFPEEKMPQQKILNVVRNRYYFAP